MRDIAAEVGYRLGMTISRSSNILAPRTCTGVLLPVALLLGCSETALEEPQPVLAEEEFFTALSSHCGKAYAGTLVSDDPVDADFAGADMVMHVAGCDTNAIAIPFHVQIDGEWDRSRTWIITRTADWLQLKHVHRHEDGELDSVTQYGGFHSGEGSASAQDFPIDAETIALFEREGLTASLTNVWRLEVDPEGTEGAQFAYQMKRTVAGGAPEERLFRVEFDLTREVEAPPPAWGNLPG